MKFLRTNSLLLLVAAAGCVTPSASVTDLTQKNLESAQALAAAHESALDEIDSFVAQVEASELALLKEARTKVARVTAQALRAKLEALGASFRAQFDDELWELRGNEFPQIVEREFREPFLIALDKSSESVNELRDQARQFPDDVPAQQEYAQGLKVQEMASQSVTNEERVLEGRAAKLCTSARERFAASLEDTLEHYGRLLRGASEPDDNSYSSILAAQEVQRSEPRPISYDEHREALEAWREESTARLNSHVTALETADRYLRGKKLSFVFVEGSEALAPLVLPNVPTVSSLGLGDVLVELRAREVALAGLEAQLDEELRKTLRQTNESLALLVRQSRSSLATRLPFLELPR